MLFVVHIIHQVYVPGAIEGGPQRWVEQNTTLVEDGQINEFLGSRSAAPEPVLDRQLFMVASCSGDHLFFVCVCRQIRNMHGLVSLVFLTAHYVRDSSVCLSPSLSSVVPLKHIHILKPTT